MPAVVLITGASSGIGRVTAEHLVRAGYTVFGTSRSPRADQNGVTMLQLDVTSEESVAACVQAVIERAGRLDVLVNNAAIDLSGAVEEVSIAAAKELFETNFFGAARMAKAVLPHMRAQGGGTIINVSSGLGIIGVPFQTYYVASKHALEGWSESLRHEVAPFGIRVSIVEPGFFRSGIRLFDHERVPELAVYARERRQIEREFDRRVREGPEPSPVARTIQRIIESPDPRIRYPVSVETGMLSTARGVIPDEIIAAYIRWEFGIGDWRSFVQPLLPFAGALVGLVVTAAAWLRRR
jgi:NAD(P)-dependent dehydrogenase (short-subunit alcohol dehydrogenase family)